jgi:hypothetical protein
MAERDIIVNGGSDNARTLASGDTPALITRALFDDTADVASSGTPTVLATNSIAANTFISDGGTIEAQYFGLMVASTNERTLRLKFNSSVIFEQLYDTGSYSKWRIDCTIIRESSSVVKCYVTAFVVGLNPELTYTRLTSLDLTSNAYNLELSADQTSNSDVTFKFSKATYTPGI